MLVNPAAAAGRAGARLAQLRSTARFDVRRVASAAEMTAEARRAAEDGLDRVLVAGGDGAVHHALQGLAGTDCALGIVPVGGGNDLARALGVDRDPLRAAERAAAAVPRRIDLGRVEGRAFAGVLGLGIDGDVSRMVGRAPLRRLPGGLAYAWATLVCLARFHAPRVRVEHAGGRFEGAVLLAALANSPLFGGGMRIAPAARLDDGWLDLVIVERVSAATALRVFPRVYAGTHVDHPAVHTARVRGARFHSAPRRALYADGEPLGEVREAGTAIEIWPAALAVVA